MVASRWGLALAAAFTVGATLLMTTGVCAHLELTPTLWGAEIFPYIALILGLENILCVTRAVVYTPPSLDVSSRISHGLAQEGYALCKYFVMELTFLAIGYATRITEIQEFCMFAFIGLVIDFYMQMFFYAPCLTFDLQRLHSEEKRQFALKLFNTDIPHLHEFVPVKCPMRRIWPQFFEMKRLKKRTLSESQLDDRDIQDDYDRKEVGSPNESFPTQAMPPHWQTWSERSYRWWLSLFAELSLSHPGGSITFVPPIVLKTTEKDDNAPKSRISWLEKHLDIYLAVMWLTLLLCVIGFVLYACFWGRWRTERIRRKEAALASPKSLSPRGSVTELAISERKSMVESCFPDTVFLSNVSLFATYPGLFLVASKAKFVCGTLKRVS
ncbi:hypothetical protein ANCDUO_08840 [Ancylostoma duodenale]|uniref:SSD domain-containing protein n=1 Tax=Ancylostoma duodenale TaxID=51022 RepID=A0A0C2DES6_9BILA|nr:hypothetical protein ANCDUO_08840 [Ancylostoma duodenale]